MNNYLCPSPLSNNSWTWTPASRLGENLIEAERIFGKRDQRYTILGVEFIKNGPCVWYPFVDHIIVQLSLECLAEEERMLFQLAHEVVHCISPCLHGEVTYLEEGAAVWFQLMRIKEYGYDWHISEENYKKALELYEELHLQHPEAIRVLREKQPNISKIEYKDIVERFPDISRTTAKELTKPMFES